MEYFIAIGIIIFLTIIVYLVVNKYLHKRKMTSDVMELLKMIAIENKISNYKLILVTKAAYDIYFETITHSYYIKLIKNFNNAEISVNNPYMWQIRETLEEKKIKFVEGIYEFVNFKPEESKKQVTKIALVYPNARALMRYINECELNFIYPDTIVNDCYIMTYEAVASNHDLIDGR